MVFAFAYLDFGVDMLKSNVYQKFNIFLILLCPVGVVQTSKVNSGLYLFETEVKSDIT